MREVLFGTCMAIVMAGTALAIAAWPVAGRPVAALFPDDTGSRAGIFTIAQADGRLLDVVGSPSWIISVSPHRDYASSLYRLGAWLVIDARMAILCFGNRGKTTA